MSYFSRLQLGDGPQLDAFGRLRISTPVTLFDNTQYFGDNSLVWENLVAGTGTVTNNTNAAMVNLNTGGTAATASAIRQTKRTFHYFSGRSQSITFTAVVGASVTNNTKRLGYFNASDGVFFEYASGTINVVLRSSVTGSPVETRVASASWNIDKFDGTGPSGITINLADIQIFIIDLQWLGAGRIRLGFVVNGQAYYCHQFTSANVITTPYMSSGSQPLRFENFNTGTASGATTLGQVCSNVVYEGNIEPPRGQQFSVGNGVSQPAVGTSLIPILTIQAATTGPNSVQNKGLIYYDDMTLLTSNDAFLWQLIFNATLTGASFNPVNASFSLANFDTAATVVSGGVVLDSGYLAGGANANASIANINQSLASEVVLVYSGLLNHQDTLTVAVQGLNGGGNVSATMTWLELGVI